MDKLYKKSMGLQGFLDRSVLTGYHLFAVLLFGFIINGGCKSIKGNWYIVEEDNYTESYFCNDSLVIMYDIWSGEEFLNYKILKDSFLLYNAKFKANYAIKKLSRKKIVLTQNDTVAVVLFRLVDKIDYESLLNNESGSFHGNFLKRFNQFYDLNVSTPPITY